MPFIEIMGAPNEWDNKQLKLKTIPPKGKFYVRKIVFQLVKNMGRVDIALLEILYIKEQFLNM